VKHPVWHKEVRLQHPTNGSEVFGILPEILVHRGPRFPAGPVYLKYGAHRGPSRGFGFEHLWKAHFHHIGDHDVALLAVRKHVAECLAGPVTVFYQMEPRLETARFRVGNVILEHISRPESHYSVVSGGYCRDGKGIQVGRVSPQRTKKAP
jgi:hypothetical protein